MATVEVYFNFSPVGSMQVKPTYNDVGSLMFYANSFIFQHFPKAIVMSMDVFDDVGRCKSQFSQIRMENGELQIQDAMCVQGKLRFKEWKKTNLHIYCLWCQ